MINFDTLLIVSVLFAVVSVLFFISFIFSIKKKKLFGITTNLLLTLLMLSLSLLFGTISLATQGYRALTREELAAEVEIFPEDNQNFIAHFTFPDGSEAEYTLKGDELYVDAHILKWKPIANILGLHTAYELDRVAGRYINLEDEQTKPRTVHSLAKDKIANMFDLRRKYEFLSPLLDAEYGSASFVNVKKTKRLNILVSTTGLLIRNADK